MALAQQEESIQSLIFENVEGHSQLVKRPFS